MKVFIVVVSVSGVRLLETLYAQMRQMRNTANAIIRALVYAGFQTL